MRGLGWIVGVLAVAGCGGTVPPPVAPPVDGPAVRMFTPRFVEVGTRAAAVGRVCFEGAAIDATLEGEARLEARAAQLVARLGLAVVDGGRCDWRIAWSAAPLPLGDGAAAAWTAAMASDERFAFITDAAAQPARTTIAAGSSRAALFALRALFARAEPDGAGRARIASATVVDAPAFPIRGVVEGFYGPPYADADRQTLIRLMGELRQNLFVYGPQNDDFDHVEWYAPYPADQLAALGRAATIAAEEQIDFVWAVRPGLGLYAKTDHPIQFSSDDDFALLTAKIEQLRGAGVRHFALFFDDNTADFTNDTDRARYGSVAEAQAALLDRLDDYLKASDPGARLLMVGTAYSAAAADWQAYNEALGAALYPDVEVFWTGNETYSATIAAADLYPVGDSLGRKPLIWDNWPARQDVEPLAGRSADLADAAAGFVSNPVQSSWQRHPIGDVEQILGTQASYGWNSAAYDPNTVWADWNELLPPLVDALTAAP